jgi:hypothetical protein
MVAQGSPRKPKNHAMIFLVVKFYLVNYEYWFLVVSILLVGQLGVLTLLKTNTHSSLNRILLLKKSGREKFQQF